MENNYLAVQPINTIFGEALITLYNDYKKISPPRIIDNQELNEHGYQIIRFKIKNFDFFEKINLRHIKFMFIDDTSSESNSYSTESKTIYIVKPKNELCFINSVLHEVGHAVHHPDGGKKSLEKELKAWLFSLEKSQKFFGLIKKEDLKVLEGYIINCLGTYCNN